MAWSVEESVELYAIRRWGAGYFDIREDGALVAKSPPETDHEIALTEVVREAERRGLHTPLLLRFQDILRHRVAHLASAFAAACRDFDYQDYYRPLYPIKVNQLREVVEEILDAGAEYQLGLEVGSKAEIHAALALDARPGTLLVCNGYKDSSYIDAAICGSQLGKQVFVVVEKLSEVALLIERSQDCAHRPFVGLRMRLSSQGSGRWAQSSGDQAKFGLSTAEALYALDLLEKAGMKESFKLLHFHIGSQIPDILTVKNAVREIARYYAKFRQMGFAVEFVDVGGGLGIDYDGSSSNFHSSTNYSIEEYARDIVFNLADVCEAEDVPHPSILSESGRALVGHHSVLVVNAFGSIQKSPDRLPGVSLEVDHRLLDQMRDIEISIDDGNLLESWHDLLQMKQEGEKLFDVGLLELQARAGIEVAFWRLAGRIRDQLSRENRENIPEELLELEDLLADQHICNFSVFQSLPDHWALGQVFPIVPIHRLQEEPTQRSRLVDITCDSDGKVANFIGPEETNPTLALHEFDTGPYLLGIFLTGAYQDIIGDIHNLFGRVNEVHVYSDPDEAEGFYIENSIPASRIHDVLEMTQYDRAVLMEQMRYQVKKAVKDDRFSSRDGDRLLAAYEERLEQQTYLLLK